MHLRVTTYLVHSSITYDPIVCKYLGYSSLTKRSGDRGCSFATYKPCVFSKQGQKAHLRLLLVVERF